MKKIQQQKGYLSLVAILLVVVVALIGTAATYQFTSDNRQATHSLFSAKAFYVAVSGIEYAKHQLKNTAASCGNTITSPGITALSGTFSVTTSLSGTQCTLTSTGSSYFPNTTTVAATRTVRSVLTSMGAAPNTMASAGPISMTGNATITNYSVTNGSADYPGSTIVSSGTVSISGSAITAVSGLSPSSNATTQNPDIIQNAAISASDLYSQYFSVPISTLQATSTIVTNGNQLSSGGVTYFSAGNLMIAGNRTVGSAANPAILFVNGDLNLQGTLVFYGLIYTTGALTISANTTITGAIASQGAITKTTGTTIINFDTSVLNQVNNINSYTVMHYIDTLASNREVIP